MRPVSNIRSQASLGKSAPALQGGITPDISGSYP